MRRHSTRMKSVLLKLLKGSKPILSFSCCVFCVVGNFFSFLPHLVLLFQNPLSSFAFLVYLLLFPRPMPVWYTNLQGIECKIHCYTGIMRDVNGSRKVILKKKVNTRDYARYRMICSCYWSSNWVDLEWTYSLVFFIFTTILITGITLSILTLSLGSGTAERWWTTSKHQVLFPLFRTVKKIYSCQSIYISALK